MRRRKGEIGESPSLSHCRLYLDRLKATLKQPRIFDGRNLYDPQLLTRLGFDYYAIGRGTPAVVDWSAVPDAN